MSVGKAVFLCGGSRGESASLTLYLLETTHIPWLVTPFLHLQRQ